MALNSNDYRALREHLQQQLLDAGLGAVLEESSARARQQLGDDTGPREATIELLRAVSTTLRRRSRQVYDRAIGTMREFVTTRDGEPVSDMEVIAVGVDRELLGFERRSLAESPDVADLVRDLDAIVEILEAES